MGNIEEYLDWRGDILFSCAPFNEVDNLILAELSYTDFEGIVSDDGFLVPLQEVAEKYFQMHSDEEILARKTFVRKAPFLMKRLVKARRFQNMKIGYYVNYINIESNAQMSATSFFLDDDSCYIAFRGTDSSLIGWKEDFNLSYMKKTAGQMKALEYLNHHFMGKSRFLRIGGHSKGGNFAIYAAIYCHKDIQKQIDKVYSNDAPGFLTSVTNSQEYQHLKKRIISFIPESSMIGILLNNEIEHIIIKSSESGVMQHDALTWQVLGTQFIRCNRRSSQSEFIDQMAQKLMLKMSEEEKKELISAIFSLLENSGYSTIGELYTHKLKTIADLFKGSATLSKRQKQMIHQFISLLIKSGVDSITDDVKEFTDRVLQIK